MTYSAYGFMGQPGQDPSVQAGLSQYATQGQMGINPGQVQVAASSPISTAAQAGMAKALLAARQQQSQLPADSAQAALTNGAIAQPNINGQNMGGVGPTMNNAAAMQGYQGNDTKLLPPPNAMQGLNYGTVADPQQATMAQKLGDYLAGLFSSDGGQ